MEIGAHVITLVDKITTEGLDEVTIPKGTTGKVCEIYNDYLLVEIWGKQIPEEIWGVYDFYFNEIKEIN